MNQAIRFLFGSPQRVITTALCGFALWGIMDALKAIGDSGQPWEHGLAGWQFLKFSSSPPSLG